jgi:hypothetical protein
MASTYVNDLRLNEMATGDASGTWGTITNTNLELIGEALSYATQDCFASNADATTTIADGATDPARAMYFKVTSSATLTATRTLTIAPNTVSRLQFIENATTGSQSINISQGSGANVTIPTGDTKAVYLDGAGSGAAVIDAFASLNVVDLKVEDDLSLVSDAAVLSFGVNSDVTITHVHDTGLLINDARELRFRDADLKILSSADGQLDIGADTELELTAPTVDLNGALTISGDTTLEDGADLITASAGTSNVRVGVNAGNSIVSGGNYNTVVGDEAGTALTTGDENVAIGFEALKTEDGNGKNTAVGYRSLRLLNAGADSYNTAFGHEAGRDLTTGIRNIYVGGSAGKLSNDADHNVAIGHAALANNLKGNNNVAVGSGTLQAQNTASSTDTYNVAVGFNAGVNVTSGTLNTLVGALSGDAITTGQTNCALGYGTLGAETQGSKSTAVGYTALINQNFTSATDALNSAFGFLAGNQITTGIHNTLIGANAGKALSDADFNVAIGINALQADTKGSKSVAIGDSALGNQNFTSSTDSYNTGIGYSAGVSVTTGQYNTLVGGLAGDALTDADYNVALGYAALSTDTQGSNSTALGRNALLSQNFTSATNSEQTAVGYNCGASITTGIENTLMGAFSGDALTDADYNVAIGSRALSADTKGSKSVAIGHASLGTQNLTSSTDIYNVAVGHQSGTGITTGGTNTLVGGLTATLLQTGSSNAMLGFQAGNAITSSISNTFIGTRAGALMTSGEKNTILGRFEGNSGGLDIRTSSNNIVLSDGDGNVRLHINSNGNLLFGVTTRLFADSTNTINASVSGDSVLKVNRATDDGAIVRIGQNGIQEGSISVSGTTISYNGGHLSRWSRLLDNSKDTTIVKGTVMTNLDEMVEWGDEDNEQLNKMAVSSVEGDANVAGVFVNWDDDDDYNDMNVAMTGDMVIRIAQGTTVARGDLLMSAGDGTAKPQGDDIVRSKTIAKVTSTNVSHTYDDGTYLVPCVLMAC